MIGVDDRDSPEREERPGTFLRCTETGTHVLRSRQQDWPHETVELDEYGDDEDDGDGDDQSEEVGAYFEIELSYSVDYRFRVPAISEHEAKERARDLVRFGNCADAIHVHSDRWEVRPITRDELDEEWSWGDPMEEHLLSEEDDA